MNVDQMWEMETARMWAEMERQNGRNIPIEEAVEHINQAVKHIEGAVEALLEAAQSIRESIQCYKAYRVDDVTQALEDLTVDLNKIRKEVE